MNEHKATLSHAKTLPEMLFFFQGREEIKYLNAAKTVKPLRRANYIGKQKNSLSVSFAHTLTPPLLFTARCSTLCPRQTRCRTPLCLVCAQTDTTSVVHNTFLNPLSFAANTGCLARGLGWDSGQCHYCLCRALPNAHPAPPASKWLDVVRVCFEGREGGCLVFPP